MMMMMMMIMSLGAVGVAHEVEDVDPLVLLDAASILEISDGYNNDSDNNSSTTTHYLHYYHHPYFLLYYPRLPNTAIPLRSVGHCFCERCKMQNFAPDARALTLTLNS